MYTYIGWNPAEIVCFTLIGNIINDQIPYPYISYPEGIGKDTLNANPPNEEKLENILD